jgi:tetratricopeptide (TPR) repeat protein
MAPEVSTEFARVFSEVVAEAIRRQGRLKKELARSCGMRPDRFSHLQAGSRCPSRQEVLRIGRGLRLDDAATDRLLVAAGFPPQIGPALEAGAVMERLHEPERAVALAEMERDLRLVRLSWEHYVGVQARNQAREWAEASDRHQAGMELYWGLRAMAARFLAQVDLASSSADPHLNRLPEAEARCEEGMDAAVVAGSRPFQVMLLARLASIRRLRSDYESAEMLYERALSVIGEWEREDGSREPAAERWRAHWRACLQRMLGTVELCKGRPGEALRKLEPSLEYFGRTEQWGELSQVCYGLGRAHGLRGDAEAAASWDRRGLDCAARQNRTADRQDDLSLLQGHLYLGGDHLDLGDPHSARQHLEEAQRLSRDGRLQQYHEVGRVSLLLGELEMREEALDRAYPHLQAALSFFAGQQEQTLLSTAHNLMGDYHLRRGGPHLQRALDHYARALSAARACRPPNAYCECAALVNICRARIRGGLPAPELGVRGGPPARDEQGEVDALIEEARELGSAHRYLDHQAQLAVLEAEWMLRRGDREAARRAAGSARALADSFSPLLLREIAASLSAMGL